MSDVHKELVDDLGFEQAIIACGFRKDPTEQFDWLMSDGGFRFYKLRFEGYAYVLYKEFRIYVKPIQLLLKIYNKYANSRAQLALYHAVPLHHFRQPEKLTVFMMLLTEEPYTDDFHLGNFREAK